jgi:uncharacterized protein YutE (UPF0331/DUF86 family)
MREELHRRLLRHVEFLAEELKYYPKFRQLTWEDYRTDDDKRRSIERWVENIINSSVDISKLILSLEEIRQPDNYKEIVQSISLVKDLGMDRADELSGWVKFRNIVAHEYLDIRWSSIKRFTSETEALFAGFLDKVKKYLEKKIAESEKK